MALAHQDAVRLLLSKAEPVEQERILATLLWEAGERTQRIFDRFSSLRHYAGGNGTMPPPVLATGLVQQPHDLFRDWIDFEYIEQTDDDNYWTFYNVEIVQELFGAAGLKILRGEKFHEALFSFESGSMLFFNKEKEGENENEHGWAAKAQFVLKTVQFQVQENEVLSYEQSESKAAL